FRLALSLQAAEHKRSTVFIGQTLHFFIQDRLELAQGRLGNGLLGRPASRLPFALPAPSCRLFRVHGNSVGDAVKPASDRVAFANRRRLASQDKKRGLEGVVDVLFAMQDMAADGPDEASVPAHQRSKRGLISEGYKLFE